MSSKKRPWLRVMICRPSENDARLKARANLITQLHAQVCPTAAHLVPHHQCRCYETNVPKAAHLDPRVCFEACFTQPRARQHDEPFVGSRQQEHRREDSYETTCKRHPRRRRCGSCVSHPSTLIARQVQRLPSKTRCCKVKHPYHDAICCLIAG